MNKVNLEIISNPSPYNQNPQTSDIEFSLLNRTPSGFKELHYQVKCREYLGDAVVAAHVDKDTPRIYGFELVNKRAAIDETILSLSASQPSLDKVAKKLKVIRWVEKEMGFSEDQLTQLFEVEGSNKLVVVGDKIWSSSPILISLYTLIIRLLTYDTKCVRIHTLFQEILTKYRQSVDGNMVYSITDKYGFDIRFFLKNYKEILGTNPLTGIDDFSFKEYHINHDLKNSVFIKYNNQVQLTWHVDNNHANTGIQALAIKCHYLNRGEMYYVNQLGASWAFNYKRLKESNE